MAKRKKHRWQPEDYKALWPNHCRTCEGWGIVNFEQSHGPGPSEVLGEVCSACAGQDICPRCSQSMPTELEGEGPCPHCNWDFYTDGA